MAQVPADVPEGVVQSRDVFPDEITKEGVRPYFKTIDCSLRVLGSQFGLDPGKLSDLERRSAQTSTDLRDLLLDECFRQEKIKSWQQFVTVLQKPALGQRSIADEVKKKLSLVSRQVSMDSAASSTSITATTPMSPLQSLTSMETSGSFSSSMGNKTGRIELCDAVNEVMSVPCHSLLKLGNNLELDEDRIYAILATTQYQEEEKRQRLVELWFRKEAEPTWEELHRAMAPLILLTGEVTSLHLGESSTSMDSVPPVLSPSLTNSMIQSNLEDIESRFSALLYSVRCALEANNVHVDHVRQILIGIFHRDDCIPRTNLEEIFSAATAHKLWDYNHHSPLEKLVRRCLHDSIGEVSEYKGHLSGFYATTKLIHYIQYTKFINARRGQSELPLHSYNTEYERLTLKLDTERDISHWSLMYVQELWNSLAEEFRIPSLTAVIDKILDGCLEVSWLIPPHEAKQIATLAPKSRPFFCRLDIIYVSLNGHIIYDINQMDVQEGEQAKLMHLEERGTEEMSLCSSTVPQKLKEVGLGSTTLQHPSSTSDTELVIGDFERRFTELLVKTKAELLQLKKPIDKVYLLLKTLSGKDFHRYVLDLRGRQPSNFDELFDDLNSYRWNCFEYRLLEAVIKRNNCSSTLRREMDQYSEDVRKFKRHTPISKVCKVRHGFLKRKSPLKGFKKLTTKVNVDPHKSMLTALDPLPEKVHDDLKFSLHLYNMEIGSIVVEWRFYEEHEYTLMTFLCSENGRDLLEQCEISDILIDDIPVDHSLLFLMAAARKDWEGVDALLQDKSEDIDLDYINTNMKDGQSALFHVVMKGQERVDLVEKMLEQGANPNIQDADGWTPLMKAVEAGNRQMVEVLLKGQLQCNINLQEYINGWSVLHIAADSGLTDMAELLTNFSSEFEIDFTLRDKEGKTMVQIAEEKQHRDIIQLLTELMHTDTEVDITQKDDDGGVLPTPQQAKVERDSEDREAGMEQLEEVASSEQGASGTTGTGVWKKLKQRLQRNTQDIKLSRAAIRGSLPDVQKALDNKANPDSITNYLTQKTPLMEAGEHDHTEIVKFLLSKGADPKKVTADNRTALTLASRQGHIATVEVLLSAGLPYGTINLTAGFWKWTVLHSICFRRGHKKPFTKEEFSKRMEKIVELLLKHGADPFIQDRTGDTALTFASFRGYLEFVKLIIESIPEDRQKELIDHQRRDNWSAILLASRHGHTEVVKYLLDKGASMTVSNKARMTALHLGVSGGHVETVKELASRADPSAINAIDGHGYTPLILATKLKNLKLMEVLSEEGADMNIQSYKEKKTALMYAAKLNSVHMINLLVQQYRADLTITDANHQTARTLATNKEVQKHIDRLLQEREQQQKIQEQQQREISL